MKKLTTYILAILLMASCSKDFLNRGSQIIFDDTNFWTSESNVKSYCWEFYNRFKGFGTGTNGDFYFTTFSDDQAASGMNTFPTAAPASDAMLTDAVKAAAITAHNTAAIIFFIWVSSLKLFNTLLC